MNQYQEKNYEDQIRILREEMEALEIVSEERRSRAKNAELTVERFRKEREEALTFADLVELHSNLEEDNEHEMAKKVRRLAYSWQQCQSRWKELKNYVLLAADAPTAVDAHYILGEMIKLNE